ncbi:MAG: sugar phosphate nucleotidyltransferase [Gammaproteobacteria bacterium]
MRCESTVKVVLFCGGSGMRIREYSEAVPKPLVDIGRRPILWHLMKYYAHYRHRDFVLCLGYKGDVVKEYFLSREPMGVGKMKRWTDREAVTKFHSEIEDWNITFVETGLDACVGQRLAAVQPYLHEGEPFLANYADGLTSLHLPDMLTDFQQYSPVGQFLSVRPENYSFHAADTNADGRVTKFQRIDQADIWMNGGFFIFDYRIFDYILKDEDFVDEPFMRLIEEGQLRTLRFAGFWACMDTFKERVLLEDLIADGPAPWEIWAMPGRREQDPIAAAHGDPEETPKERAGLSRSEGH